jgi:uncharacterized membrane protein YkgB
MENKKKRSKFLRLIGIVWFVGGILILVGYVFDVDGASLSTGLVGTALGYLIAKPEIDAWFNK